MVEVCTGRFRSGWWYLWDRADQLCTGWVGSVFLSFCAQTWTEPIHADSGWFGSGLRFNNKITNKLEKCKKKSKNGENQKKKIRKSRKTHWHQVTGRKSEIRRDETQIASCRSHYRTVVDRRNETPSSRSGRRGKHVGCCRAQIGGTHRSLVAPSHRQKARSRREEEGGRRRTQAKGEWEENPRVFCRGNWKMIMKMLKGSRFLH